ncbi:PorP/SprF family type IX secretion system membrane protein [Crocinitomix catalasitica]|uniref:PorP/SprF family type IX secretion system membrane protein n=1 Tax=Crocinitomix catalasitica TaxID=184607 RepID=UPI0004886FEC|nr:PorP/SprF family type IX secretion system membrane protein [Crocinitomix catalasitica]
MKFIVVYISLLVAFGSFSQQTQHYTQYQFNQFAINPAMAGTKNCIDIRTGFRYQWAGVTGAPQIGFINGHGPIRFKNRKKNLYGPKSGIGLSVTSDKFGAYSFLDANLAYAVHIPMSQYWKLSIGLAVGMKQTTFSTTNLTTEFIDPVIPTTSQSFIIFPDAKLGFWLANKSNFIGISIHNLFGNRLEGIGDISVLQRHFYMTAGKRFKLQKKWSFQPSFFLMKTGGTPMDFHLSALFDLDNKFSIGMGIRRTDAITAQIRFKLFDFLSIGYSFDFVISKINNNIWQTHELTAGFNSCSNYGNKSTTSCATFE